MPKAKLALAIHFHQPVGNFDHVFERVYDRCYLPFLEILNDFPSVKVTLHYSGALLEWLEKHRPEIFPVIAEMASSGQIELMGGGFYEPILPIIPYPDRVGQITLLREYLKKKFRAKVEGGWLSERVWEPDLPEALNEAGIKYVIVDDTHLFYAGIRKKDMYGYYLTEEQNKTVAVFPSDKLLRYYLPFRPPQETIDYFRKVCECQECPLFIYGDDGEKFGEWPGTHQWVYREKWLVNFFNLLLENGDWLEMVRVSDYLKNHLPLGRVYLPTASYEEMSEWALPVEAEDEMEALLTEVKQAQKEERFQPFIRGGFWRNFLVKYPEANHLHKKMLYVSRKLQNSTAPGAGERTLTRARKELYKGQCNCAYWHGVFGGLYLYHLRSAAYRHLLKAESLADEILFGKRSGNRIEKFDFDADGQEEIILENNLLSLYLDPGEGGMVTELDYKPVSANLVNTLSRRRETYHKKLDRIDKIDKISDEKSIRSIHENIQTGTAAFKEKLFYDRWRRGAFIDHFLSEDVSLDEFIGSSYRELGDFCSRPYSYRVDTSSNKYLISLERKAQVSGREISVVKKVEINDNIPEIRADYLIGNSGRKLDNLYFGVEFNLTPVRQESSRYVCPELKAGLRDGNLLSKGDINGVSEFGIVDEVEPLKIFLRFSSPCKIWYFPVCTLSQSERALEFNYQGSAVIAGWKINLSSRRKLRLSMRLNLKR